MACSVPRELFPLPHLPEEDQPSSWLSRGVRQRVGRRRAVASRVNDTIDALNSLMGFSSSSASRPSLAQRETLERLHAQHVSDVPQVDSESSEEACAALLGLGRATAAAYGGDAAPHIAPYDRSLLSIPGSGTQPVHLEDILDKRGRERVVGYRKHLMISADDWGALCEKGDDKIASYTDPRLRGHSDDYKGFIEDIPRRAHQLHLDGARDHLPSLRLDSEWAAATGPGLPRSQPTVQEVGAHPTGLWLRVGRHRARARHRPVRLAERHQGLLLPLRSSCRTEPTLLLALGPD